MTFLWLHTKYILNRARHIMGCLNVITVPSEHGMASRSRNLAQAFDCGQLCVDNCFCRTIQACRLSWVMKRYHLQALIWRLSGGSHAAPSRQRLFTGRLWASVSQILPPFPICLSCSSRHIALCNRYRPSSILPDACHICEIAFLCKKVEVISSCKSDF